MSQRPDVPGNVVAPSSCLDPMHTTGVDPDQVARPLHESVTGYSSFRELLHAWPPRPVQVIDVVLATKTLQSTPIFVGDAKPF